MVKTVYSRYSIYFYYLVQNFNEGTGARELEWAGNDSKKDNRHIPGACRGGEKRTLPWVKTHDQRELTINNTALV